MSFNFRLFRAAPNVRSFPFVWLIVWVSGKVDWHSPNSALVSTMGLSNTAPSKILLERFAFKADYVNIMQRDLLLICSVTHTANESVTKKQSGFCSLTDIQKICINVLLNLLRHDRIIHCIANGYFQLLKLYMCKSFGKIYHWLFFLSEFFFASF